MKAVLEFNGLMTMRKLVCALIPVAAILISPVKASCFDRTMAISRYFFPNPANLQENYQDIFLVNFGSSPAAISRMTKGALATPMYDSSGATFSPAGDKLIFFSNRATGFVQLYAMDANDTDGNFEGDNLQTLTTASTDHEDPSWVTSNTLVYISYNEANSKYHVFTANPDLANGTLQNVVEWPATPVDQVKPSSARNGAHVLFSKLGAAGPTPTRSIALSVNGDSNVYTLIDRAAIDQDPALKLGTSQFVFSSDRSGGSQTDLYTGNLELDPSPAVDNIAPLTTTADLDENSPQYSVDGLCIAYIGNDRSTPYGPNDDLYIKDLTTDETRRMTSSRDISGFSWKP